MFCFYMDDSRLPGVLNELWQNEASKFSTFITRSLTDFPEIPFFKRVLKEFDENTQNIDVLVGRLKLLEKRTVDENDDPMVLISIIATVYKGNIIKNLIMDCQSYTKYRPNETTGGIFVSWRRKEELPTGA